MPWIPQKPLLNLISRIEIFSFKTYYVLDFWSKMFYNNKKQIGGHLFESIKENPKRGAFRRKAIFCVKIGQVCRWGRTMNEPNIIQEQGSYGVLISNEYNTLCFISPINLDHLFFYKKDNCLLGALFLPDSLRKGTV
jgi:hypothetical protein